MTPSPLKPGRTYFSLDAERDLFSVPLFMSLSRFDFVFSVSGCSLHAALRCFLVLVTLCVGLALSPTADAAGDQTDALDRYVQRLRADAAGPRKETGFMSPGSDFLYGQDYFEAGNFSSAAGYFRSVVNADERNAFAQYQLGVCLGRSDDPEARELSKKHLEAALRLEPALKERLARDLPSAEPAPPANDAKVPAAKPANATAGSLAAYIARLRQSRAAGGPETAMNSPGQSALYGIEHYERNEFDSAATNFRLALARDAANPYVNYLLAVSLAAMGDDAAAATHRAQALAGDAALATSYAPDVAAAKKSWAAIVAAKQPKTSAPTQEPPPGGALIYGNYVCSQTVWNGPGANPQFRSEYQGYFELKANGTYRWLDDGVTGRYRYDANTGRIEWLSGHFAATTPATVFRRSGASGLMSIEFGETHRWNAICEKR